MTRLVKEFHASTDFMNQLDKKKKKIKVIEEPQLLFYICLIVFTVKVLNTMCSIIIVKGVTKET